MISRLQQKKTNICDDKKWSGIHQATFLSLLVLELLIRKVQVDGVVGESNLGPRIKNMKIYQEKLDFDFSRMSSLPGICRSQVLNMLYVVQFWSKNFVQYSQHPKSEIQ